MQQKKKKTARKTTAGRRRREPNGQLTVKQRLLLDTFEATGRITVAIKAAGIAHSSHYRVWLKQDTYRLAFEEALKRFDDADKQRCLEEIRQRAYGYEEEVIEQEMEAFVNPTTGKAEMVPKRQKRRKVKRWSVPALLWLGNRYYGNPANTGPDGQPIRQELTGKDGAPFVNFTEQVGRTSTDDLLIRSKVLATAIERLVQGSRA